MVKLKNFLIHADRALVQAIPEIEEEFGGTTFSGLEGRLTELREGLELSKAGQSELAEHEATIEAFDLGNEEGIASTITKSEQLLGEVNYFEKVRTLCTSAMRTRC